MVTLVRDPISRFLSAFSFTHGSLLREDSRRPVSNGTALHRALVAFASCGHMHNYQLASLAAKRSIFLFGSVAVRAGRGEDVVWRAKAPAPADRGDLDWLRTHVRSGTVLLAQTEQFSEGMRSFAAQLGGAWRSVDLSEDALAPHVPPECVGSARASQHCAAASDHNPYTLSAADIPADLEQELRVANELDQELHRMAGPDQATSIQERGRSYSTA